MQLSQGIAWAVAAVLAVPAVTAGSDAGAADQNPTLRMRVVLHEAMARRDRQEPGEPSIILNLQRTGQTWERVWATAGNYNRHDHFGRVDAGEVSDEAVRLDLTLSIKGDPWVPGGRLGCEVNLKKQPDGAFGGTYKGTIRGVPIAGKAEATVLPPATQYREPADPAEHPRLLFRAEDLSALRKKAETPFGKLALAKMTNSAAGSAFRYAMTGDKSLAADARRRVKAMLPDRDDGDKRVRSRWWGWRIEQAAIAYDLCYEAWDEDFRNEVAEYLNEAANILLYNRGVLDNHISWNYGGAHAPTMMWAAGVAGLAIAGEKGPEPVKPAPSHLIGDAEGLVEPVEGLKPGKGVEIVGFTGNVMPRHWIYAGPFPDDAEPLATDRERGSARPQVGQRLGKGDAARTWRKITEGKGLYKGPHSGGRLALELTGPSGVATHTNSYYYTVLKNDRDRWARVHTGHGGLEMYLGGVRLTGGDVVRLKPGLYPWLVTGPIGEMNPWGKSFAEPKLIEMSDADIPQVIERARADYANRLAFWQQDHDQWTRTGGADVHFLKTAEAAEHVMDIIFMELLGKGGFMSGADMMQAMDGPNKYALMYRNVTGRNASGFDEASDYLPRKMFVHPYRPDHKVIGQEINGMPDFICSAYPESGRDAATETFAPLLPLVREAWQPTMLWGWNYHTGGSLESREAMANLLAVKRSGYAFGRDYGGFDTHPIYAFLNYPLDMEPKPPEGIMPRTWQAPDFGFYGFRNKWTGQDDQFITQFLSSTYGEGAGTLRVAGLGQVWSHGLGKPAERRYGENVVQFPDDEINVGARGKVTYLECDEGGSGVISIDLSDVYSAPVRDDRGQAKALYDRYGDVSHPGAFGASGITGMRSMAVDYSGKSGTPCMVVIVDRIQGGKTKNWTWQLESKAESAGKSQPDPKREGWITFRGRSFNNPRNGQLLFSESNPIQDDDRIDLHNDGFTFTQDRATMRATFVAPAKARLELAEKAQYRDMAKGGVRRDSSKAVFAEGGDEFFVILTFQKGPAPDVQVVGGRGLDATVKVGRQTVRFDGEKIILGE